MPATKLPLNPSLLELRTFIIDAQTGLEDDDQASDLAPPFQTLLDQWTPTFLASLATTDATTRRHRKVLRVDAVMDGHVVDFGNLLKVKYPVLSKHFFGKKAPSVVVKPILGNETTTVAGWLDDLAVQKDADVLAYHAIFTADVAAANAATTALTAAQSAHDTFRAFGDEAKLRAALADLRDTTFAELDTRRAAHPEWKKPRTWATSFFRLSPSANVTKADKASAKLLREAKLKEKTDNAAAQELVKENIKAEKKKLHDLQHPPKLPKNPTPVK